MVQVTLGGGNAAARQHDRDAGPRCRTRSTAAVSWARRSWCRPTSPARDSFYGLIESCGAESGERFRARRGRGVSPIVNTDVALSAHRLVPGSRRRRGVPVQRRRRERRPRRDRRVVLRRSRARTPTVTVTDSPTCRRRSGAPTRRSPDTDGDRLTDGEEVNEYGTDPLNVDSDFDRLYDEEITFFGTDPLNPDTDGDGCWDHGENVVGRNPLDPADEGGECFEPNGSSRSSRAEPPTRPSRTARRQPTPRTAHRASPATSPGRSSTVPAARPPADRVRAIRGDDEGDELSQSRLLPLEVIASVEPKLSRRWNESHGRHGDGSGPSLDWDINASVDITLGTKFTFEESSPARSSCRR